MEDGVFPCDVFIWGDPDDDTRLSNGSRLVDALALRAVWLEVSRVG